MANWTALRAAIAEVIKTNGNKEITGAVLQSTLNTIVSNIGEAATFKGLALTTTVPGTPDGNVFYMATNVGIYPNFGGIEITEVGIYVFIWQNGSWWKNAIFQNIKRNDWVLSRPMIGGVNFHNEKGVWKLTMPSGIMHVSNGYIARGNNACDMVIPTGAYQNILIDLTSSDVILVPGAVQAVYDTSKYIQIGKVYPEADIFSMRCDFTVNGSQYPRIGIGNFSSIITKKEWATFTSIGGYKFIAGAGTIQFQTPKNNRNCSETNLSILDGYIYLVGNAVSGEITANDKAQALSKLSDIDTYVLIGVCYPQYEIYDMRIPFNVDGKPYNMNISNAGIFDLSIDTPAVTNTLSFKDNEETPIYKDALFKTLTGGRKTNVILETTTATGKFKRLEIHNPTYLKAYDIGNTAKIVFETQLQTKIYKEITRIYKGLTTGHAATLKLMTIGDSLTQGNGSTNYAPMALIKDKFVDYGIAVQPCGTFNQDDGRGIRSDIISEGRGYWNYKCFVGKDSSPYGQPITISTGTGLTSKFENPFLRLATTQDKTDHPDWCFTNSVANPADPDGVSYATNPAYTNYYIFDFAYYLTRHSVIIPDVITIALGINDWQEPGTINVDDEYLSMQIMYKQIRAALPNVPIMLIPTNGIFPTDQTQWETEMFQLLERIITYIETQQATDLKLHLCPIYQHVARFNAYNTDSGIATINTWNNIKQATMSDVHVLDKETSRKEYYDAFESTLLSIIN